MNYHENGKNYQKVGMGVRSKHDLRIDRDFILNKKKPTHSL